MEDTASLIAKEVLVILFRALPGRFVLVGGGALHWIYHSPRLSVDLDLKPLPPEKGLLPQIEAVLKKRLPAVAAQWGIALRCENLPNEQAVRLLAEGRPVLRIELVSLVPVGGKEKHLLQSDSLQSEIIVTPDIHQLLFAKAAAFLKRSHLKGRDVFDLWFLQERGAQLDSQAFQEWLKWEEKDASDIRARLEQATPARLRADVARFLPDSMQRSLEEDSYKTLIDAAERLFKPFL